MFRSLHTFCFLSSSFFSSGIISWIHGVLYLAGAFAFITWTGGWMAGRQRVTMHFCDVMEWKSVCLIVLKMRLDPRLGCICLVAGKWAVSEESYLVRKVRNASGAFRCSMSIWSAAGTSSHMYTWLSVTEPIRQTPPLPSGVPTSTLRS